MTKFAGVIIILHISTKNHYHMTYISWDKEWDRHANDPKNQNFEEKKNEENAWSYYPFIHMCTINVDHMIYGF